MTQSDAALSPAPFSIRHPATVRLTHAFFAVAFVAMTMSGLQILWAFPFFDDKIPAGAALAGLPESWIPLRSWMMLGPGLANGIAWHFAFALPFLAVVCWYGLFLILSGSWRRVVPRGEDLRALPAMVAHYVARRPAPAFSGPYNPLQKVAYSSVLLAGLLLAWSGLCMFQPVQFAFLAAPLGGHRGVRIVHFGAMAWILGFLPLHIVMAFLAGPRQLAAIIAGGVEPREAGSGEAGSARR